MPFVKTAGIKLHYRVFGNGPEVLLAFHGYGQDSNYFNVIAESIGADFTIYSFDLFYHGKSVLAKNLAPLQKEKFTSLIGDFIAANNINRFSLMGFSMGGKFVLSLLEVFSDKINNIYLIAPDGIGTSFWYNVATYPGFFQQLFKRTVIKPERFFRMLSFMHRGKIVDKGLIKFAGWQMNSLAKRMRVYRSWMGFRKLTFDLKKITDLLNQNKIELQLFIGEHDRVIDRNRLKVFARSVRLAKVVELPTGHSFLLHQVAGYLKKQT